MKDSDRQALKEIREKIRKRVNDSLLRNELCSKLSDILDDPEILFCNFYKCPDCQCEWEDTWDSQCDDECPECGKPITPYKSEDIE